MKLRSVTGSRQWPLWLVMTVTMPVLADGARDVATLPAVTVSGEREAAAPPLMLGKLPLSARATPQSMSVIGQDQLRQQNLQNLDDVMWHATGITLRPHSGLTTAYYSRGFKVDAFEQDGVPVMMGNIAAPPDDVAVFERIEILRGANGLLHGAGNPAATVNLVRKRPQREFTFDGELSAGSWDRYRAMADLGGPLNGSGSVRGRLVGVMEERGFFYQAANQKTGVFYGIGAADLGPDTVLSAGLQYQRVRAHPPPGMGGLPRYQEGGDLGLKRSTNLESIDSHSYWNTTRVFADLEYRFGQDWNAKISVNHLKSDSDMKYLTGRGSVDPKTGQGTRLYGGLGTRYDNSQTSVDAYVSGSVELFGRRHALLFGANSLRTSWENANAAALGSAHGTPIDALTWSPRDMPRYAVGPYRSSGKNPEREQGVYGMGRLSLTDPVTLVLGGRLDWSRLETPSAEKRVDATFTPYGGLIVDLDRRWSLYGSYAQVFKPQSEKNRDGEMLDPMTGTHYEAGIKGELAQALNLSLALFQSQQKNRAQADPALPCPGRNCPAIAGGKARSRGFEAEASGNITSYWNLMAGYTFNTTRYLTDTRSAGQTLASFTPKHLFRLWTEYALPAVARRLRVGGGVQVQSGIYSVAGPITLRQGGYALADVRVAYRVDRRLTVALNVNNLFDRVYYQRLGDAHWNNYYGEPRNLMLTVRAEY